ncbi:MAG: FMN-binding protein [Bacteroidetes bacterium]|nr:FMN-binding protein [Bacteroidota bacterium]
MYPNKTPYIILLLQCCLISVVMLSGCAAVRMHREMTQTRNLQIEEVDLQKVSDGSYTGSYSYAGFSYKVVVVVGAHRITQINILQNRTTGKAKLAEDVIPAVVKEQKVNVDAHTGATSTSKALLKAVEDALKNRQ